MSQLPATRKIYTRVLATKSSSSKGAVDCQTLDTPCRWPNSAVWTSFIQVSPVHRAGLGGGSHGHTLATTRVALLSGLASASFLVSRRYRGMRESRLMVTSGSAQIRSPKSTLHRSTIHARPNPKRIPSSAPYFYLTRSVCILQNTNLGVICSLERTNRTAYSGSCSKTLLYFLIVLRSLRSSGSFSMSGTLRPVCLS